MSTSDREAVVEVVNHYAHCLDEREWITLNQVFTVDAVGHYGGPTLHGRDAIVRSIRSFLDGCGPTQHLVGSHLVRVEGDEAFARCKARVYHHGTGERAKLTPYECFGVYRDRLRQTPEGWRIVERTFDVQHTTGDPAVLHPGSEVTA